MTVGRLNLLVLGLGFATTVCSVGCGSGPSNSTITPETAITKTQNPLVVQYQVTEIGPAKVWVEFGQDTSYGKQTSDVEETASSSNVASVLVAGMKANTTYHMRAHVDFAMGASWVDQDQTIQTGPLPSDNHLGLKVTRPNPNLNVQQDGVELLDISAPGTTNIGGAVADLDGNIIWYYDTGTSAAVFPFPIKPLPNGHMLINLSELAEVDLAGTIVRSLSINSLNQSLKTAGFSINVLNLHHDVLVLQNGHWVVLGQTSKTFTNLPGYPGSLDVLGDVLIDLDQNWKPVWVWSSFDHLDVNRHLMGLPDWTHSNAVVYSSVDGNILLSMRNQSWILKIDYENGSGSGDVLWRLGEGGDFQLAGNDPSQWFYAQHYPYIANASGTQLQLVIFDDGNLRIPADDGPGCQGTYPYCYSRAVQLGVDESSKSVAVQWEFLPDLYTPWGGSIVALDNGDVEFAVTDPFGQTLASRVLEVTGTSNPEIVWQLDITGGDAYRAYRIPSLYPGVVWH
jgi:arylsulfate sulfotransferase